MILGRKACMENKNQSQYTQSTDTNNLDFAVSFIAGTLIGSVVGYAVKPFVTRAVNFTHEHELTNVNKHSQKLKQEALRKAEEIKEKAQHIKDEALHKTEAQQDEPTTAALEAQQRAIRSEVDSDKLQVPTKPTYHFSDEKDKPVDLSALKSRHDTMATSDKPKEEVAVSSLAAMRQATAVDKKNEEVTEKAITGKPDEAPKQEVAVSSLAAMRQAMAADKKDGKVVEEKPKATTVEQRVPQTHREARFENGVITHEKSSQAKQTAPKKKATPSKKANQSKPTAGRKKATQPKKTQAKKTPAKKAPAKKSQAKATSQAATKSTKAPEAKSSSAKKTQAKRKASQTQTKAKSTQAKRTASQSKSTQTKNDAKVKKTTNKVEKHTFKSND